ncbi:MAG TPA: CBS domain-containing protein [Planctomycetota bacterium]|nr:CBS domain-containing protein [Planctomycetota bacterium]
MMTLMKVHELMTPSPMTCRPTDSLHDVAQRLWNEDCGSLPVVDGRNRLVGMITDRDVAMAGYLRNRTLSDILVADTMSQKITACAEDDSVETALQAMQNVRVHRLPVCDADGTLRGILAFSDVLRGTQRDKRLLTEAVETLSTILEPRSLRSQILMPAAPTTAAAPTPAAKEAAAAKPAAREVATVAPTSVTPASKPNTTAKGSAKVPTKAATKPRGKKR